MFCYVASLECADPRNAWVFSTLCYGFIKLNAWNTVAASKLALIPPLCSVDIFSYVPKMFY